MSAGSDTLLLVLPVAFRVDPEGRLCFESQACNGLERWAENFGRIIVACPKFPDAIAARAERSMRYLPVDSIPSRDRIEFIPLPWAFRLLPFLREYRRVRGTLADAIRRSDYLMFAIGGLVGDWASVAASEADRQGRRFSVWTDRVEHRVAKESSRDGRGLKNLYRRVLNLAMVPLMKRYERRVIRRADLGLFHGRDCFDAYAPLSPMPRLVHNIHLKAEDRIGRDAMLAKAGRIRAGGPLRLLYAGRASSMKGSMDWLRAMADLKAAGVDFRAAWLGDGPLLEQMRGESDRLGLAGTVELAGFVGDRAEVTNRMREADLFVFCHKTPESPRCLIEALVAATPILGYDSAYPRDLLEGSGDELLTPIHDPAALARRVAELDRDREALAALVERCYELGAHYSDVAVFRHRSDLIKEHLGPVGVAPRGSVS